MFRSQLQRVCKLASTGSMSSRRMGALVSTEWVAEKLKGDTVRIVHASWSQCQDYKAGHLPGAVCFDGDHCRDRDSPYKNMLPTPQQFATCVGQMGIDNDTDVVVYDAEERTPSVIYAVRVWYMFRVFGHDRVALMNGGMKRWVDEKRNITQEVTRADADHFTLPVLVSGMDALVTIHGNGDVTPKSFTPKYRPHLVLSYEDVLEKVVKRRSIQLVDARQPQTYRGTSEDPSGKSGHIPGALNVPYSFLLNPNTKLFRDEAQLEKLFKEGGVDLSGRIGTSCGTGMTATAVAFAAFMLGKSEVAVYDGSWYEWARRAPDEYIAKK